MRGVVGDDHQGIDLGIGGNLLGGGVHLGDAEIVGNVFRDLGADIGDGGYPRIVDAALQVFGVHAPRASRPRPPRLPMSPSLTSPDCSQPSCRNNT